MWWWGYLTTGGSQSRKMGCGWPSSHQPQNSIKKENGKHSDALEWRGRGRRWGKGERKGGGVGTEV